MKKRMWILLAVLIVLLLCYIGIDKWTAAQEKKRAKEKKSETIQVETLNELSGIAYEYNGEKFSFIKVNGVWQYEPDPDFPLEQSYVDMMEDAFTNLTAVRELKDGDTLEDYGLVDPAYTITLTGTDGTVLPLYIGNAAEEDYYMTLGEKEKIYTVGSSILSCIQYDLNAMMAGDTFPIIGSGSLKSISIEMKKDSKQLTMEYSSEKEEDQEQITALAGALGAISLTDCADYHAAGEELKTYGLDEAERAVVSVVYTNDDEETSLVFCIGAEDDGGNRYVKLEESDIVYRVSADTLESLLDVK